MTQTLEIVEHNFNEAEKRFAPVNSSQTFNRIIRTFKLDQKKVLELGCGYGEYLVKFGKDSLGITTTAHEVAYGKEKGIRIVQGNAEVLDELHLQESFDAIWANNLFEHLLAPHAFLMRLKPVASEKALLILGVPTVPRITSLMHIGKFRGALATPHINFFTKETLKLTVERTGWRIVAARPYLFQNSFLDWLYSFIAPHIYVVAENDTSFVYPEKKYKEWKDEPYYQDMLRLGNRT